MMGDDIRAIQAEINAAGYIPPLVVDGRRGPKTRRGERWLATQREAARWADAVPGIDVSGNQGKIDGRKIRAAGYRWAIVKASEGTHYTSTKHGPQQVASLRDAGIAIAGYYMFPGRQIVRLLPPRRLGRPADEADHFLRSVNRIGGWFPGAWAIPDLEAHHWGASHDETAEWYDELIGHLQVAGHDVLAYITAPWLWARLRNASAANRTALADVPAWAAHYGSRARVQTHPAKDFAPWRPDQILVHQYEGRRGYPATQVPGVQTTCDVNRMIRSEWKRLAEAQGVSL